MRLITLCGHTMWRAVLLLRLALLRGLIYGLAYEP